MRAKPTSMIGLSMLASRWRWEATRSRVSSMEKRTLRDQRMWGNLSTRPARNLSASRCIGFSGLLKCSSRISAWFSSSS